MLILSFNIDIVQYKFTILKLFNIPTHFYIFRTYKQTHRLYILYGPPVSIHDVMKFCSNSASVFIPPNSHMNTHCITF